MQIVFVLAMVIALFGFIAGPVVLLSSTGRAGEVLGLALMAIAVAVFFPSLHLARASYHAEEVALAKAAAARYGVEVHVRANNDLIVDGKPSKCWLHGKPTPAKVRILCDTSTTEWSRH